MAKEAGVEPPRRQSWLVLAGFLAASVVVSAIGGAVTAGSVETWYPRLIKPGFTPPDWVFGPVWTVLYVMMAVAAWLVWRRTGFVGGRVPLGLYAVQLTLNLGWSVLFFGLRWIGVALAEIALLWVAIAATAITFGHVDRRAGWLLVPYLLWVGYATVLNAAIWQLQGRPIP
ncbi:MAG: tryptophan-rich sensory protein [Rhodospirillales bacterium]|nr:MAG: tryptophan-rich sensory protein [Rhodospirillales bacterium]